MTDDSILPFPRSRPPLTIEEEFDAALGWLSSHLRLALLPAIDDAVDHLHRAADEAALINRELDAQLPHNEEN